MKALVDRRAFSWTGLFAALEEGAAAGGEARLGLARRRRRGGPSCPWRRWAATSEDALALLQSLQAHGGVRGRLPQRLDRGARRRRHRVHRALLRPGGRRPGEAAAVTAPFWRTRLLPRVSRPPGREPRRPSRRGRAPGTGGSATPRRGPRRRGPRSSASARPCRPCGSGRRPSAANADGPASGSTGSLAGTEKADLLPTLEAIEEMARSPGLKPGARTLQPRRRCRTRGWSAWR